MIKSLHFHFGVSLEQIIFFSSKFSGKGVGAMPYLLANFWSRDSMYDVFFLKFEKLREFFNFHTILLHFALLDINNLFTTLD